MQKKSEKEMSRRITALARHNKALAAKVQELQRRNEELLRKIEEYGKTIAGIKKPVKQDGKVQKHALLKFRMATVLYAEIRGFSNITKDNSAKDYMDDLDNLVSEYEVIAQKYNIKKVKTIGDTFMYAGGVPEKNSTNPVEVVMAAFEMMKCLERLKQKNERYKVWELRIGIHTGPVTAVISSKKQNIIEIKGDTVNVASRIGAACGAGKTGMSANTYEFVKEFFACDFNGKMPVRYISDLPMYYLTGIRPDISVNGEGTEPDGIFYTRLRLMQFTDIQEAVLDKMERELPRNLYYHNIKHTIDVVTEVELIGWAEGVSEKEILLLKAAALFHDSGHIESYEGHEEAGVRIARRYLKQYGYSEDELDEVENLILATRMPPEPKNLMEEIICDSDLDYLGRGDFIPVSNLLYNELKERNKIGSIDEWNRHQIRFINKHQYYTETARKLREVNKRKQIERLKKLTCSVQTGEGN